MSVVTCSLWLPIGRANFFSMISDPDLIVPSADSGPVQCRSLLQKDPAHIPHLRASVMRRLLEVLPRSFGYDPVGTCEFSQDLDESSRVVSVSMTLAPSSAALAALAHDPALANGRLVEAGVTAVNVYADENGNYTFAATYTDDLQSHGDARRGEVQAALLEHVAAVFGGDFAVNRLRKHWPRGANEGNAAVRRYNGLADDSQDRIGEPKGVLTFFQLNILVEGLFNLALLPAVFFEHYDEANAFFDKYKGSMSMLTNVAGVIKSIATDADATQLPGQATALHRFLAVSRGQLERHKRSVESVRRSLLDRMMAVVHRQARLIQLNLAATKYESTPELTGVATESQMRGYVILIAAKLSLIYDAADVAGVAIDRFKEQIKARPDASDLDGLAADLDVQLDHWKTLLEATRANVRGLETAVEHDWQERLFYEQEQARSEQEAMAEIERSRRGRPEPRRMGETTYNAVMLILTAVAVLIAVKTTNTSVVGQPDAGLLSLAKALWPIGLIALFFYLIAPVLGSLRRLYRERRADSETYSFEFAFRLDEPTTPKLVNDYLSKPEREKILTKAFGSMKLRRLGGWRVERISPDTTLVKVHSVAAVRVSWLRYARFEVVTEVLARKISDNKHYFLRQCRMFGDSPKSLSPDRIRDLAREILTNICTPLAADGDIGLDEVMLLADPIFGVVTAESDQPSAMVL